MDEKTHLFETLTAEDWADKQYIGHKFFYCDLNHVRLSESTDLYGSSFYGCAMQDLEAEGFEFDHVQFHDCDFKAANLKKTKWNHSRLYKCDMTWSDLTDACLDGCVGEHTEFKLSKIHKAEKINVWDRDMISELVRVAAKGDPDALAIASLVKNSLEFCWREWSVLSKLPQWERTTKVLYECLKQYPSVIQMVDQDLLGGS